MIENLLILFSFSAFAFIIVLLFQKQDVKQFHWIFILFMIMYNAFTALNFLDIKPSFIHIKFDLSYNEELIAKQLIISALCILSYLLLLIIIKNKIEINDYQTRTKNVYLINLKILYMVFYPIALYFVYKYPWPEMGQEISFGNSISAYLKNIELVLMIMIFVYYPFAKKWFFLLSYIVIILVDTQRTPLMVALISYLLVSDNKKILKNIFLSIFTVFLLALIAIYRNGVSISFINFLYPFYLEGIFGSYSTLQSFEIIKLYNYDIFTILELLFSPLHDIVVKMIPNIYFETFNTVKANAYLFPSFINENIHNGNLTERWSPMGGFFYIAESNLMIPYVGPILFTVLLFFFSRKIAQMKNLVLKVLLYSSLFLYVKANIFVATKYIIFLLISYYSITIIDRIFRLFLKKHSKKANRCKY